jgi:hypothetical protein
VRTSINTIDDNTLVRMKSSLLINTIPPLTAMFNAWANEDQGVQRQLFSGNTETSSYVPTPTPTTTFEEVTSPQRFMSLGGTAASVDLLDDTSLAALLGM